MKGYFSFLFTLAALFLFSQTQQQIDDYKSRFFLYPAIGTDSALKYVDKIFSTKKPIDLAFAYTAKRHLLTITGKNNDEKNYLLQINHYLDKVPEHKVYFTDLSNIHNILGNTDKVNGKYDNALNQFLKAETFAKKSNNIKQIIKVKGNIALIKGDTGFINEGISETKKALSLLQSNKSIYDKEYHTIQFYTHSNNLGHLYIEKIAQDKEKNRNYIDSAMVIFQDMLKLQLSPIQKAFAYENLGSLNNFKKNYKLATICYENSLRYFTEAKSVKNANSTKYNIAYNYYEQKKYDVSKKYFWEIIKLEKDTSLNFNYLFSHEYLARIYLEENNKDSANYYLNTFLDLYHNKSETDKKQFAEIYKSIENKNITDEITKFKKENSSLKSYAALLMVFIVLIFFLIICFLVKKKKLAQKNLEELLDKIKSKNNFEEQSFSKIKIDDEKEQEIINGLIRLEKEKYFLKQEFSLYNAAKKIGTNTTYLTNVTKNYKGTSFNSYTNELRINYLLDLLMTDKKIRNYTIQSLAELIGYKNGSSFSKIFKEKTKVTPYQFIEKLKKDQLNGNDQF